MLVPAARGDVCIAHVQQVGDDGTVRIDGQRFADVEAMKAADKVIVMAEEIVPEEELRRDPAANVLAGYRVDAIVECCIMTKAAGNRRILTDLLMSGFMVLRVMMSISIN